METKELRDAADFNFSGCRLPLIAVYQNPFDYPGKAVARLFDADQPTEQALIRDTLQELMAECQKLEMLFIPRGEYDDEVIVGTWI